MSAAKAIVVGLAILGMVRSALAADLTGAWVVNSHPSPSLSYTLVCILAARNGPVSGPCVGTQGQMLHITGRASDSRMRFKYTSDYNGSGVHLEYDGLRQPDGKVIGTVTAASSSGAFNATTLVSSPIDHATTWKIDVNISDQFKYVLICTFRSDGQRFSGPCATAQGPTLRTSGTAADGGLKLGYDTVYEGRPVHVDYAGSVQGDGSLTGTVRAGTSLGTFTASRQ